MLKKEEGGGFKLWYALSLAFQLGFLVVAPLFGFMFLGWWLDKKFKTLPIFLFLGILIGVAVAFQETYHLISFLIKERDRYD